MKPHNSSEIPIMFEQLDQLFSFIKGKKVISPIDIMAMPISFYGVKRMVFLI